MRLLLPIFLTAAISSPGLCGELGPTSRGTVTIRVTIPQHIDVARHAPAAMAASGDAGQLCLVSNGTAAPYRVSVLAAQSEAESGAEAASMVDLMPVSPIGPSCGGQDGTSAGMALTAAVEHATTFGQPVTLLVAPQ